MPKSCPTPRLGFGCSGVAGREALPCPPRCVLERADEACLGPGALGEGFKVLHQDADICVFISLQYLKSRKQPCESFPRRPVALFLLPEPVRIYCFTVGWDPGHQLVPREGRR